MAEAEISSYEDETKRYVYLNHTYYPYAHSHRPKYWYLEHQVRTTLQNHCKFPGTHTRIPGA